MYFLAMNMSVSSLLAPHLARRAVDDASDERRNPVVLAGRLPDDRSHDGHVRVLESASQGVSQQHFGRGARELLGAAQNGSPKPRGSLDHGAIPERARRVDSR